MKRATESDLPAIQTFLHARPSRAMFPLSNIDKFGLDGDHDYSPSMWFSEDSDGISGVLTVGRAGVVMPCLPQHNWDEAAAVLAGRSLTGFIGSTDEVRPLMAEVGLTGIAAQLDRDEPHFELDLADLIVPDGPGKLVPLQDADPDEMIRWRADYTAEVLQADRTAALEDGRQAYHQYVAHDTHRVLMADGVPVATTGFNAQIPQMVQIGGVYTPPALRGRGHARRAVALHLAEARVRGVTGATLFAASDMAVRAYQAIGFRRIGTWTLCLFGKEVVVDE